MSRTGSGHSKKDGPDLSGIAESLEGVGRSMEKTVARMQRDLAEATARLIGQNPPPRKHQSPPSRKYSPVKLTAAERDRRRKANRAARTKRRNTR